MVFALSQILLIKHLSSTANPVVAEHIYTWCQNYDIDTKEYLFTSSVVFA